MKKKRKRDFKNHLQDEASDGTLLHRQLFPDVVRMVVVVVVVVVALLVSRFVLLPLGHNLDILRDLCGADWDGARGN